MDGQIDQLAALARDFPPADVVSFGDLPTQELRRESASKGLTWLYKNRPQVFADMMLFVHDLDYSTAKKQARRT